MDELTATRAAPPPRQRRNRPPVGRILAVLVGWTAAWWTLLGLVIHPVVPGGLATLAVVAVLQLALPLAAFSRAMTGRLYPGRATRLFLFRPFWYLQVLAPLLAMAGALGAILGLPFGAPGTLGRFAVGGAAIILAALGILGWVGSRSLVTRQMDARFPDLPGGLDGLRIVQLSDLHVGPHTPRRHLDRVRDAVRAARPDLIVFTGDQVDDYPRDTEPFARAFAELRAPLGVFAVAGNHDIYAGWAAVRRGLEAAGQRVLVNEAVPLRHDGDTFWLAGTGDPAAEYFNRDGAGNSAEDSPAPDLQRTLATVPRGAFVIALAHNPALWPALAERGVPLTLSGHTHHGQLSIPRLDWSLASIFLEHAMGSHRRAASLLYISPGTNYWGLPFRIGSLPEVTVLTLRRRPGPALHPVREDPAGPRVASE